ncbi:Late embryogenesis abundant protein, LEA-18 [Dillenia turbinata]|uniref:Late embryogenesis abundant protein, LEA-18 n=1 Tax=Dillenia turbinata TaxID=194707 RepID=A0AAN8V766_9MAGN
MEGKIQRQEGTTEASNERERRTQNLEGLPLETSPYVNYGDVEDYKLKGYGTQGHLDPKPARGGGGGGTTDAPTPSGCTVASIARDSDNVTRDATNLPPEKSLFKME